MRRNGNPRLLPQEACMVHVSGIRSNVTLQKSAILAVLASFHLLRPGDHVLQSQKQMLRLF